MPRYADKATNALFYRTQAANTPDRWRSPQLMYNSQAMADQTIYAEEVTEANPENNEDGTPMQPGNFCLWCDMGGHYEKRESERGWFLDNYVEVDSLPDQPEGPYSILQPAL